MRYLNSGNDVIKITLSGDEKFNLDYSIIQNSNNVYGIEIQKNLKNSNYSEIAVVMISDLTAPHD